MRVKLIVEESTMQNQVIEIAWAKPPGLFAETRKASLSGSYSCFKKTRLTGNVACDWHDICNNAGCPTIVDWQAI
tara:strand:- start:1621 stop:1845 length:225 start_codon:yes stop_codon:yes gene_type:complete